MHSDINIHDIVTITEVAGIAGFTGIFTHLGAGEVNDTFILDCNSTKVVLRISKYNDVNILSNEARALGLLNLDQVPKLIYFNETQRIKDRSWIIESHLNGYKVTVLTLKQFEKLGELLAKIHKVKSKNFIQLNYWKNFLDDSQHFGDEQALLNHPDTRLNQLINSAYKYLRSQKPISITPSLIHGDVTPSNMLKSGDEILLIDWEFSKFNDSLVDFSTLFYEDMEYNKGRWRIHIKPEEKAALFEGYLKCGGVIDKKRLKLWQLIDKLGAAVYLYWKINQSGHEISSKSLAQYNWDLDKLINSLQNDF